MKSKIFYSIIVLIALISLWSVVGNRINNGSDGKKPENEKIIPISLNDNIILAEVADTSAERSKGLSGQIDLPTDHGLLFIFDEPNFYNFWMKEMNFPLDIVWLDQNFAVVDITNDLKPESYPKTVTSKQKAQFVLELNAGSANRFGLKVGDTIKILGK